MRKRLALLLVPCLLLASAFALSACGGSDSDSEGEIEDAIQTSVTSTDPAKCTDLMTTTFINQSSDLSGDAAVEECEEEAGDTSDDPDSVTVTEVEVDGAGATAPVAFAGGVYDGQTIAVALVEEDGDWKLDEITGFAKLDAEALATSVEEQFEKGGEISPAQISCIGDGIREAPQGEIEELLFGGSSQPLVEFAEACE
ncbi:MAG TPA: hypothetical protein VFX45_07210 [Solirubrobacterales bacterium]|nr:hypothetical protein [Solirubrobacterales bacterium]